MKFELDSDNFLSEIQSSMQKELNSEVEDLQLARACLEGNEKAQKRLFDRFSGQMMAVCMRYGNGSQEAEDMFQDGFIKVFQKLNKYNGKGPLGAWIRRTMVNNALDQIRKKKRENDHVLAYEIEHKFESSDQMNPLETDEPLLPERRIMELIHQMPTGYRTVFNLYVVEEYSHKEIAQELGVTESTSKTQYRKAKSYMRNLIEEELKNTVSD